jgi:electron transfer flavoprotein alpha/beta subunit
VPSLADIIAARQKPYECIDASVLKIEEDQLGLMGSYTQVVKIFPPGEKKGGRKLEGLSPEAAAQEITAYLRKENLIRDMACHVENR